MLWGFTPAADLIYETKFHFSNETLEEINILLIGCQDPRHILKTVSQRYRDDRPIRINFYVVECVMEVIARHLILLTVSTEPGDKLGLREKTRLYMDIFGNSLMRPTSAVYVINKTFQLIRCVTDLEFLNKRLPFIKLDRLKYKERDSLENILMFWQREKFKISKLWDSRLRHSLGTRYDSRNGAFDWDYHMKLKDLKGCEVINSREYLNWRQTGVAFTWLETEFSVPNPTFAVGVTKAGDKLLNFGYHGDIQFGPYFTLGIECPDKEMLKTINSVYAHRSTDLIQRNLMRMFHEIENKSEFCPERSDSDRYMGTLVSEIGDIDVEETYEPPEPDKTLEQYSSLPIDHTITFLPVNSLTDLHKKPSYNDLFHIVYLSQAFLEKTSGIMDTAKNNAVLILETQKAFFTLKKEEKVKFGEKIEDFAKANNCDRLFDYDPTENYFAFFKKKSASNN